MSGYVIRRAASSVVTLLLLLVGLFFAVHAMGDPVRLILGSDATQGQYAALTHQLGYDRPLLVQFADYMARFGHGDLGQSISRGAPALDLVLSALPKTLFLAAFAFLISLTGVGFGLAAAVRPRGWLDSLINSGSFALVSAPHFWIALLAIYFFAVQLRWLPTSGFNGFSDLRYIVMPAFVLSLSGIARLTQMTRTSVLEELTKTYVQTANAKGLAGRSVLWRHVLKNASIPILTVAGDDLATIISGSVIMETLFGWPGMGFLLISAIAERDLPLVIASVVIVAALVMLLNFVVDVIYSRVDPRIQYR
jgi:peptide/nickel transport system permease protein